VFCSHHQADPKNIKKKEISTVTSRTGVATVLFRSFCILGFGFTIGTKLVPKHAADSTENKDVLFLKNLHFEFVVNTTGMNHININNFCSFLPYLY